MYCGNCGTQNDDFSPYCIGCGARLNESPALDAPAPAPKKSKKGLLIAIVAAVVAIAVALVLIFTISTPKSVVKKFVNAVMKADGKTITKLLPKDVKEADIGDKDAQKKAWETSGAWLETILEQLEEKGITVTCKVTDVDKLDKDAMRRLQEEYEYWYDCEFKDARKVTVEVTVQYDGEKETNDVTIRVIKVGGRWYVDFTDISYFQNYLSLIAFAA